MPEAIFMMHEEVEENVLKARGVLFGRLTSTVIHETCLNEEPPLTPDNCYRMSVWTSLNIMTLPLMQHHIHLHNTTLNTTGGRAIAQAVSRRLPTAAARVQTRVLSCGIL
jgi:hypothetical protein